MHKSDIARGNNMCETVRGTLQTKEEKMEHFCVKFYDDVTREYIDRINELLGTEIDMILWEEKNLFLLKNTGEYTIEELIEAYSVLPIVEFVELPPGDRQLIDPEPDASPDPVYSTDLLPPPGQDWTIGKNVMTITFVKGAEREMQYGSLTDKERALLQEAINKAKNGTLFFAVWTSPKEYLEQYL